MKRETRNDIHVRLENERAAEKNVFWQHENKNSQLSLFDIHRMCFSPRFIHSQTSATRFEGKFSSVYELSLY